MTRVELMQWVNDSLRKCKDMSVKHHLMQDSRAKEMLKHCESDQKYRVMCCNMLDKHGMSDYIGADNG